MHRRSRKSGFTLIELMVVILILGILAAVVGFAIIPAMQGAKSKLDANALTDFKKQLGLALAESSKAGYVANYKDTGKPAADLYKYLVTRKVVAAEHAAKLAGATGTKLSKDDWENPSFSVDPSLKHVVFTSPAVGAAFLKRANATSKSEGVLFVYNKHNYNTYPNDGIVLMVCGDDEAKVIPHIGVADLFSGMKETPAKVGIEAADFYGKFPFKDVAPE